MIKKTVNNPHGVEYPEAVTADGQLVSAINLDKEYVKTDAMRFYFPGCEGNDEDEMVFVELPHRKGVTKFFRHKAGYIEDKKDPDRYLHNYAELRMKQRFDESEKTGEFFVQYYMEEKCPHYGECKVKVNVKCQGEPKVFVKRLNLRDLYDTCTIEKGEDKYIADLLLEDSKKRYPSTMLEVFVTHKCSDEKKESGKRIIEITIRKEEDADNEIIENKGGLTDDYFELQPENKPIVPPIQFYGFNTHSDFAKFTNLQSFTLTKRGVSLYADCKTFACNEIKDHNPNDCAFSLSIPSNALKDIDIYEMGMAKAHDLGLKVRDCTLCNQYKQPIRLVGLMWKHPCILIYKDKNGNVINKETPYIYQMPYRCDGFDKSQMAADCRKYSLDNQRVSELVRQIENKPHLMWVDKNLLPPKPIEHKNPIPQVPKQEKKLRLITPQECFKCPNYSSHCDHCLGWEMKEGKRYVVCDR